MCRGTKPIKDDALKIQIRLEIQIGDGRHGSPLENHREDPSRPPLRGELLRESAIGGVSEKLTLVQKVL